MENMNLKEEKMQTELLNSDPVKDFQLSDEDSKEAFDIDKVCSADSDLDAEIEKCQQVLNQASNFQDLKNVNNVIVTVPTQVMKNTEIKDLNIERNIESINFLPLEHINCDDMDKTVIKKLNKNSEIQVYLEIEDDNEYIPCRKRIKLENVESVGKVKVLPTTSNLEIVSINEKSKTIDNLNAFKNSTDVFNSSNILKNLNDNNQNCSESCHLQNDSFYEVVDSECESIISDKLEDTSYREGDTLILCTEESDFDSELEKTLLDCCEEDFSDDQSLNENSDIDLILNTSAGHNNILDNILNETDTSMLTVSYNEDSELKEDSNESLNEMNTNQNNQSDEGSSIDAEIENFNKIFSSSKSEIEDSKFSHANSPVKTESFLSSQGVSLKSNLEFNLKKEIIVKHEQSSKNTDVSSDNMSDISKCIIVTEGPINTTIVKKEEPEVVDIKPSIESNLLLSNGDFNCLTSKTADDCKVKNEDSKAIESKVPSNIDLNSEIEDSKTSESKAVPSNIDLNSEIEDSKTSESKTVPSNKDLNSEMIAEDPKEKIKDYLEDEKDDIANPEWQTVKNLNTNEERYQQVRQCWKSKTVPDPNKNLTYHSYRKKQFRNGSSDAKTIRQHKRHASSSLSGRNAKRVCTFFLDKEIDSVRRIKQQKKEEIMNEMNFEINNINQECFNFGNVAHNMPYHNFSGYDHDHLYRNEYNHINHRVLAVEDQYIRIAEECEHSFENKIGTLNERRNEVLKFYSFYKGLNDSDNDPTLLTESQFQELDEIENIYKQFNYYYKNSAE